MEPNKPTPRRTFGTDASLTWVEQLKHIERASSKAVTSLSKMLDSAGEGSEVAEIVRALSQAQQMCNRALSGSGEEQELTDEQLARAIKK